MANTGNITLNDLNGRFKAAGVYTVYRDETVSSNTTSNAILRLIYGCSKTGIFNTPVYIEKDDYSTAKELFGELDKTLERKKSFFHRAINESISESAVLAINLLKTNDSVDNSGIPTADADIVPYQSFSTDVASENGIPTDKLFSSYFNKERFWTPSSEYLLATRKTADKKSILNFVNLSQNPLSFIIRKSDVKGFDITCRDWYSGKIMPACMKPDDFISDYFVDVIVIKGDYSASKYQYLSQDAVMGKYFDKTGLIISQLEAFLSNQNVNVVNIYTGCLIPNFKDTRGTNQSIEFIVNRDTRKTGLLCAIDRAELDAAEDGLNVNYIDLVGHRLLTENVDNTNFLSYSKKLKEDMVYTKKSTNTTANINPTTGVTVTTDAANKKITVVVTQANADFAAIKNAVSRGMLFHGETTDAGTDAGITISNPVLKVVRVVKSDTQIVFDLTSPLKDAENAISGSFVDLRLYPLSGQVPAHYLYETTNDTFVVDGTGTYYLAEPSSAVYADYKSGILTNGDKITDGTDTYYVSGSYINDATDFRELLKINLFTNSDLQTPISTGQAIDFGASYDSAGYPITDITKIDFISNVGSISERLTITIIDDKNVLLDISLESKIKVGQYLHGYDVDGNEILSLITNIKRVGTPTPTSIQVSTANSIKFFTSVSGETQIERYYELSTFFDHYNISYLKGFTLKASHMPNGTNARMKEILSVLTEKNMQDALCDPEMIDFRYVIDTFNHGLESQSKRYISKLIQTRQKCLGLLNAPSKQEFVDSTDPRFTDSPTAVNPLPTLNVDYIATGGNLDENPSFRYSLPYEEDGASYVGFFFPNVIVTDDDGDEASIPPAIFVGNNFIAKYRSGNPFKPVAGIRRGTLKGNGISRMEYPLTIDQRGVLEAMGINPIYQKKNGDIVIMGNETAYKKMLSILNNINARDTLITITIDIEAILEPYEFEYNDDTMRTEVKSLLENYLNSIKNGFGAITSFDLIFDRNNNPSWVVRNRAAIVDVVIELPEIAKKFINRITLRSGGGVQTGGFLSI